MPRPVTNPGQALRAARSGQLPRASYRGCPLSGTRRGGRCGSGRSPGPSTAGRRARSRLGDERLHVSRRTAAGQRQVRLKRLRPLAGRARASGPLGGATPARRPWRPPVGQPVRRQVTLHPGPQHPGPGRVREGARPGQRTGTARSAGRPRAPAGTASSVADGLGHLTEEGQREVPRVAAGPAQVGPGSPVRRHHARPARRPPRAAPRPRRTASCLIGSTAAASFHRCPPRIRPVSRYPVAQVRIRASSAGAAGRHRP